MNYDKFKEFLNDKTQQRQALRVLAFVVLIASSVTLIYWELHTNTINLHEEVSFFKSTSTPTQEEDPLTAPYAEPVRLSIPAINITADFETPLGVDENGAIDIPNAYETVGWYKHGSAPGTLGPAVVLGHVDSYQGPAIFFYLGQVSEGDEVLIERNDGSTVIYEVTELERVEQNAFPTEKVYGSIPYAGLRLITCSGTYDKGEYRYSHNLIVYAQLKGVE